MSVFDRFRRRPLEQKSVSLPEVLYTFGRVISRIKANGNG